MAFVLTKVDVSFAYPFVGLGFILTMLFGYLMLGMGIFSFLVSQVWMKTHRGEMNDDPLVFAVHDRASLAIAILMGTAVIMASVSKLLI